jgi:hypothetical protein
LIGLINRFWVNETIDSNIGHAQFHQTLDVVNLPRTVRVFDAGAEQSW